MKKQLITIVVALFLGLFLITGAQAASYQSSDISKVSGASVAETGMDGAAHNGKLFAVLASNSSVTGNGTSWNATLTTASSKKTVFRGVAASSDKANLFMRIYEFATGTSFLLDGNGTSTTPVAQDRQNAPSASGTWMSGVNKNNATDGTEIWKRETKAAGEPAEYKENIRLKAGYVYLFEVRNDNAAAAEVDYTVYFSEH